MFLSLRTKGALFILSRHLDKALVSLDNGIVRRGYCVAEIGMRHVVDKDKALRAIYDMTQL